ncbi:MAG: TetR/AcrR family transcriptional regulator [Anaerolineae bacterium]|nr:TetR/AcrR family transcriptional regulator [Anaerolineae bacterium]
MSRAADAHAAILDTAERLFKEQGYHAVLLADIATQAKVPLPALQTHFHDKSDILNALLERRAPRDALRTALRQINKDSAEEMVRAAIREILQIFSAHADFLDLAILDVQVNNSNYVTALFSELAGDAAGFITRLANMPNMRPISTIMLARALASMLIGFAVTQYIAPRPAQYAMRIFPQRAWIEGMADILLYGIVESE